MALIINQNQLMRMSDGSKWKILGRVSFDNFYLTGGMLLLPETINLVQIDSFSITGSEQGFLYEYDYVNNKLKVFSGAGAASGTNSSVSGGTPSGTNASVSAGTPSGTNSVPTFVGSALANHVHALTLIESEIWVPVANVVTIATGFSNMECVFVTAGGVTGVFEVIPSVIAPATGQVSVNHVAFTLTFFAGDAVTSITVSYLRPFTGQQSGGVPSGVVSAPIFTGAPLGIHTHTFSGAALAPHTHIFTGGGGGGGASEIPNGTNLSFLTNVEFEAIGL